MTLNKEEIKRAHIRWYVLPGIGKTRSIKLSDIEKAVCSSPWCTITKEELVSNSRGAKYSYPRAICMLLAKILLKKNKKGVNCQYIKKSDSSIYSPSLLKKRYKYKGHSVVCLNVKNYLNRMDVDKNFREMIEEVKTRILFSYKKEISL
jgi:hypothetical protein